jgi:hypothetical protein
MIGATYSVLASAGSDRNLGGALSTIVPVIAEGPSAAPPHHCFPLWMPVTHLPSHRFTYSTPCDLLQKPIQYPATGSGSVQ